MAHPSLTATRLFDPARFETFRFVGWRFEDRTAVLEYALDDELRFSERIGFPGADGMPSEPLLELLHLVAGVSYYKLAAPPSLSVESGAVLDDATAAFLTELYVDGLGQFGYENGIRLRDRVRFETTGDSASVVEPLSLPRRTAVPIGGGKDSIVTLDALRAGGEPIVGFSVGNADPIRRTVAAAGVPLVVVERELSPQVAELNAAGALNGHVPVTAVVSAIACAAAPLYGFDAIAMSNERSASEANLDWEGGEVNHQWSKGLRFERLLRDQLAARAPGLEWFSFLRPHSELAIARAFARLDGYDLAFTSCNAVFRRDPARRGAGWCGDCPKCRFVFLVLAPWMEPERLERVFGRDLLHDSAQLAGFRELTALGGHKPFECVGEEEESAAAFRLLAEQPAWRDATVVRALIAELDPGRGDPGAFLEPSSDHCLPPRFEAMADALR